MSTYLYGVVRRPGRDSRLTPEALGPGVGDPAKPVRLLTHRDLAAVVSTVGADEVGDVAGVRALRRDMAAHAEVLSRVAEIRTVLPSRFGIVLPADEAVVETFLEPQYERLLDSLARLKGAAELSVTAEYQESEILREVLDEQPQLARDVHGSSTYQDRIDFGRRVATGIRNRREQDADWILRNLEPLARDVAVGEGRSDLTVLRASFLVERRELERFDRTLEAIQAEGGKAIQLSCVGPLPAYSFVDVRVSADH
jgi:hypothetical protein